MNLKIESVEVMLDAPHEYRGDLHVVIESPSGTKSVLAEPYRDSDEFGSWTFTSVRHGDELSEGTWMLTVSDRGDHVGADTGCRHSWKLMIHGTEIAPPPMDMLHLEFNGQASPTQEPVASDESPDGFTGVLPSDAYSDDVGYGWVTAPNSFDRGGLAGSAYSDLLREGAWGSGPREFGVQLVAGSYEMTVRFGDPGFARDRMNVALTKGSSADLSSVSNVATAAGQMVHRTFVATTDPDGELVLQFSDAGGDSYWTVAGLEIRPAAAELMVNAPGGTLSTDGVSEDTFQIDGATSEALYTVSSTLGQVVRLDNSPIVDADLRHSGLQIVAPSESFSLQLQRSTIGGTATLTIEEVAGASRGSGDQAYEFNSARVMSDQDSGYS